MKKPAFFLFLTFSFFQIARTQSVSFEIQAGLSSAIRKVIPIPGRVCVATVPGDLVLWDPSHNRIDSRLNLEEEVYDLAYLDDPRLIAVSTPTEVLFFEVEFGRLNKIASYSCDNPTAMYYSGKNLFVATRDKFVELELNGSEIHSIHQIPKNSNPTYGFRVQGNRIFEASNLGFHIFSMERGIEKIPGENNSSMDTSSLEIDEETEGVAAPVIAALKEFNTGWYAHTWDEERGQLFFPREASLMVVDYSSVPLKAEMIYPVADREELITGLARIGEDLFMGNRSGYIYRFSSSAKPGRKEPVRTQSASLTHLAAVSGLLTVGDFYGNISLYDPTSLDNILSLNDESTPAINGVYLDGNKKLITTHKDPSGTYLSVWDIGTADLLKRQRFLTQQIVNVLFSGDSIKTFHADGASYWIGPAIDTFCISPSMLPYEPAFGMSLPDNDPMLKIQQARSELREALLLPGTYNWKDESSGTNVSYMVPPLTPGCEKLPSYEQVQMLFRETGIMEYLETWDQMDQDIFFMKACRNSEEVFLENLKSKNIPEDIGLRFYRRLRSPRLPKLSIVSGKGDTLYTVRKNELQYLAFHPVLNQWILFYPDSVAIVDLKTKMSRGFEISPLPVFFHYALTDSSLAIASVKKTILYELDKPTNRSTWLNFGTDQFLVHNKEGFYRISGRSSKLVGFEGNEIKDFSYFDLKFNRPDIVVAELSGENSDEARAFRAAVAKRLNRTRSKQPVWVESAIDYELPIYSASGRIPNPKFQIPNPESQVRSPKTGILHIWVNGTLEKDKGSKEIHLSPGLNKIELRESSKRGDTIFYSDTRYIYTPQPATVHHYYFGAGINEYSDKRINLQYAVKDISDVASHLKERIPGIVVKTLFNEKVGAEGFAEWRERLEKTSINDVVMVSLSGHGYLDIDSSFHFASASSTMDQYHSAISYDSLLSILDAAPARRKLLLIDACHSGLTDTDSENIQLPPGVKTKTLKKKQDAASATKAFRMMQEEFLDLTKHNGTIVIAAAGGAEFALETADHRNGLFTYALIRGLFEGLADNNNDKRITTTELQNYLGREVTRLSGGGQMPSTNQDNQGLEWWLL